MGVVHVLERSQVVPRGRDEVFRLFSDAGNLDDLTPPFLHFRIDTPSPIAMAEGTLIDYRLRLFGVPFRWRTRIESWEPGRAFSDRQLSGPYREWHHRHEFEEVPGGTLVRDVVRYRVPFGPLGAIAHVLLVKGTLEEIFDYRHDRIAERLGGAPVEKAAPAPTFSGRSIVLLLASVLLVALVAVLGGVLTRMGVGPWYGALVKPSWNPPARVFGPVWTVLYVVLAVAAWLVARHPWTHAVRRALALHGAQLAGQVVWSGLFFALKLPLAAAVEIVLLLGVSIATAVAFARVQRVAGLLLVPYLLWASFAAVLSGTIAFLNR